MKYSYQARDAKGARQTGIIEASSRDAALEVLGNNSLFPLEVNEVKDGDNDGSARGPVIKINLPFFNKISQKDVAMFSRQMAIMIDSNVPPAQAIEALGNQTKNKVFQEKIYKIATDIRGGTLLSKAFGKYPEIFSVFYVNMMKSGEASGNLPKILEKVADHLESEYAIRSKILGAMLYPIITLIVFVVIFVIMMVFVIPGLVSVLQSSGQQLPLATKMIIGISDFFVKFWYIMVVLVAALVAFFVYYPKTEKGKDFFDKISLKLPILGNFLQEIYVMRLAENFSTLIAAGVPIAEALDIVSDLIGNNVYKRALRETRSKVVKGESVSQVFGNFPDIIPPLFVQMASVGEQTGRLDSSLTNVVTFYKRETDIFIDSLSSIIEPVMIIGLAVMVGFLVAGVLLPIYQISSTIPQ
jgi:type IV pilus assembly protein PilC